ncbi:MAG: hypothetical protein AB7N73_00415 [Gemmatimonadales bacterium]
MSFRVAVCILCLLAACTNPEPVPTEPTPAWLADHVVADTPLVVFGAGQAQAGIDLSRSRGVVLLSDGRLAVFANDDRLLLYAAEGDSVAVLGGRGEGPGQFRSGQLVVVGTDTLLVYDSGSRRLSWFDPDVGFLRSEVLGAEVLPRYAFPIGGTRDGRVLLTSARTLDGRLPPGIRDTARTEADIIAVRPDSSPLSVLTFPDLLVAARQAPNGSVGTLIPDNVRYAGHALLRLRNDTIFLIAGGSSHLELHEVSGRLLTQRPLDLPRASVTPEDRAALIALQTAPLIEGNLGGHAPPPNLEATIAFMQTEPFADSFPAADDLLLEADGSDLLVVHGGPFQAKVWRATRLDPAGAELARIEVALPRSRPVAFSGNTVLLEMVDDDGVTTFELRRLVARSSGSERDRPKPLPGAPEGE